MADTAYRCLKNLVDAYSTSMRILPGPHAFHAAPRTRLQPVAMETRHDGDLNVLQGSHGIMAME
jgi:hypothetical protein